MAQVKNICLEALERHCASGDRGRLDFQRGAAEGQIFTHDRLIVHAQLAGLEGIPALFRLFDWGDAETIWQPGIEPDKQTLHLSMEAASMLYAENLQERSELGARERERLDKALTAAEVLAGIGGADSVLKHYMVSLECSEPALLPDGFTFADAAKSSYVIGSGEDCDVILNHPSVDPLHCGVILEKGSVLVWDLGALSGVKLNGNPISEDMLKVGDVMTLGALDLRVRFQLRRPKVKPKEPVNPDLVMRPSGTMPLPKITQTGKMVPKGAITYEKVSKQLGHGKGMPFLAKLTSLFGAKKPK
jgi:hypothetical protein